jgi:phosphorylcholine metabolism protein LicD
MRHGIDFFRDEIRNGFYIPTAVKQSWAAALDVLAEIDRICKKHDIRYFADWGTILGAVRHGGFVPWDDDLDICMLRDDYVKFRAVCDAELPDNYCIHDYERHNNHWLFLARVVNNHHICFDEKFLDENYNFPWLTGIDIFVKDYLYKDPSQEKKRCDEVMHILAEAEGYIEKINSALSGNGDNGGVASSEIEAAKQKAISLYKKAEEKMAEVPTEGSDKVCQLFPWGLKGVPGEDKEFYQEITYLPFEDTFIPVPAQYNRILTGRYGDYNVVRKGLAGHDYPSFDSQRKGFESETGTALPRFSFDKDMLRKSEGVAVNSGESEHGEVLFLPIGPSEWKSLESAFVKECTNPDTDVYVVPLPLMQRDIFGQIKSTDEEILAAEHFDDYVNIINDLEAAGVNTDHVCLMGFTDYDLQEHTPARIYIQSPYDAHNPVLTVPPYYYADNLRLFTSELIYIPLGPVGEFSDKDVPDLRCMDFYVTMPGTIYADKVIVQSENIKSHYVDKLVEFCAGTDKGYWEKKIVVGDALNTSKHDNKHIKRILYGISSYEYYEHKENFAEVINSRMAIFTENKEKVQATIYIYPDNNDNEFCKTITDLAAASGIEIVDGISPTCSAISALAGSFDAYYGSSLPIVQEFVMQKKPVMIADYSIT